MERMKTFLIYFLIFVAFYVLTDVLVSVSLANSYKEMSCTKNDTTGYSVQIGKAEATNVSGYVEGSITKKEDEQDAPKYLQFEFYSKYGHCMGRKYIDLGSISSGEKKDFKVNFELNNIVSYQISTVNEVTSLTDVQLDLVSKGYLSIGIVGALVVLYYVL